MARLKSDKMTQVKMQRFTGQGEKYAVGWIESNFAKIGNYLEDEDTDVWQVVEVYNSQPTAYAVDHERDYLKQREASDI
jgi:hypothetical protein